MKKALTPFGQWVERVRVERGMQANELARRADLDYQQYRRYLVGERKVTPELAVKIGGLLGDEDGALRAVAGLATESGPVKPGIRKVLPSGDIVIIDPEEPDPDKAAAEMEILLAGYRAGRYGTAAKGG